jgi:multidrug transporter EmrE-like cation transporter
MLGKFVSFLKRKIKMGKLGDMFLDVVKYVATGLFIYPLLAKMDKDWTYYLLVGVGMLIVAALGFFFHYHDKNDDDNNNDNNINNNNN